MSISNQECILPCKCCSLMKDILCLLTGKRIFPGSFGNQSCTGWGQLVLPQKHMCSWIPACTILSEFQVWLLFALCNRFLLYLSVQMDTLTAHLDTVHLPPFLGKQTEGQCAPRMYLHCSCIISWHSGSSELRSDAAARWLHKNLCLYEEGVLLLASWAVFLGLPQK